MKIVFIYSHETYSKKNNTKSYTSNSYVLVFLIKYNLSFFLLIIWDEGNPIKI